MSGTRKRRDYIIDLERQVSALWRDIAEVSALWRDIAEVFPWFRLPLPPEPQKRTRKPSGSADCRPCATCGRTVAHTKDGRAYLHRCEVTK